MAKARENKVERQAAVAAAAQPQGKLTYQQRRTLAQHFGCTQATIYRDMIAIGTPNMATSAPAVLALTASAVLTADRDIAILRLLGRLEFVTTAMLKALIAPDLAMPALRTRLARLLKEG